MVSNLGFDVDGLPYVEVGADMGAFVFNGERVGVLEGDAPVPVNTTIERSVDGGDTWERVAETVDATTLTDPESLSYGDNLYRAVAETAEGATSETVITVEARSGALWLSGGAGFGSTCRLPLSPHRSISGGRATAARQYAGRSRPVFDKGEALSDVHSISGTVTDRTFTEETTSPTELRALIQSDRPLHMLRTPDGERIYGGINGLNLNRNNVSSHTDTLRPWNAFWGYSFELTEGTGV